MRRGLLLLLALLTACGRAPRADGPVQRYEVDGIVAQLPSGPASELMIRHVEIRDFVSAGGDTVGMAPMTMGFPLAGGVDLGAVAVGDSVRFTFEVRWGGSPPLALTSIRPLPPGTPLDFGKRR